MANRSIDFFEEQFQKQVRAREFTLTPFEEAALRYISSQALALACGLGSLSLAPATRGCEVVAVDAVVPVLIQGTSFMEMFDGNRYCLFKPAELDQAGPSSCPAAASSAPNGPVRRFSTVIAQKPS